MFVQSKPFEMLVVVLFGVLLLCGLVRFVLWKRRMNNYVSHLPTSDSRWPLLGSAGEMIGKDSVEIFAYGDRLIRQLGTPLKAWIGPMLNVTLDRPDDIKTILMSADCLDKPYMYRFMPSDIGILTVKCKYGLACGHG